MTDELDRQARIAVRRHDARFYDSVLQMVLGNMVRLFGVRETRRIVLVYARRLKWF